MKFDFGGIVSGFSEQLAEDIQEDSKRVKLILDKAWDRHTERFISKRDKEEKKAELVEQVLKKIGSYTNNNADIAASVFNKLGGDVDLANEWLKGASQVTSATGQSLQDLGYISSLPEDFKSSGISINEYAKSFGKGVQLDKIDTSLAGMITRPDALGGIGSKRAESYFGKRAERLKEAGLMPEGFTAPKVDYADINVDLSLKNVVQSTKDSKAIISTLISRAPEGPKKELLTKRLNNLIAIETEAEGIDASKRDSMNKRFNTFLKNKAGEEKPEITGLERQIGESADGGKVITYTVKNMELYTAWKNKNIKKYADQFSKGFSGSDKKIFDNVYDLNTANIDIANSAISEVKIPEVKLPEDLINEYKQGKTIVITQALLDAYPNSPKLQGKQVGQTLTLSKAKGTVRGLASQGVN